MKNLIARTLTLLMLAVSGLTMASAQTTSVIKVNVPFEFSFADRTFPAGGVLADSADAAPTRVT